MKNVTLDNSIDSEIGKAITWQYDNAENLVNLLMMLKQFFNKSTKDFWDSLPTKLNIAAQSGDTIDEWGLAVWGKLLGIPRPQYYDTEELAMVSISKDFYRRILLANFRLRNSNASFDSYVAYCTLAFNGHAEVIDDLKMGLTFVAEDDATEEEDYIITNAIDRIVTYPSGVRSSAHSSSAILGFDGQAAVQSGDPAIDTLNNASLNYRLTPKGNWTI